MKKVLVSPMAARVYRVLRAAHGCTPIKAGVLQRMVSLGEDASNRNIRAAVLELNEAGVPVISGSGGFRIARGITDLRRYQAGLVMRKLAIERRVWLLEEIMEKRKSKVGRLVVTA